MEAYERYYGTPQSGNAAATAAAAGTSAPLSGKGPSVRAPCRAEAGRGDLTFSRGSARTRLPRGRRLVHSEGDSFAAR